MTTLNKILIGILIAQVGLVTLVRLKGTSSTDIHKLKKVFAIETDQVNRVELHGRHSSSDTERKEPVVLVKDAEGNWTAQSHFDYPADSGKVLELIGKLAALKARGPMAKTEVRQKQLEVAPDGYAAKVVLTQGTAPPTTIYLGAYAGQSKTIAVRQDGDNDIYAVGGLSAASASGEIAQWISTDYFEVEVGDIESLEVSNKTGVFDMHRGTEGWDATVDGTALPPKGKVIDRAAIDKIANAAARITIMEPGDPSKLLDTPTATIAIHMKAPPAEEGKEPQEGAVHTFDVHDIGGTYLVVDRLGGKPVQVRKTSLQKVVEVTADALITEPPKEEPAPAPKPAVPGPRPPVPNVPTPLRPQPRPAP